jgi:hypothetical protein
MIPMVSVENPHGYVPESYVGAVLAAGSTVYEAAQALEQRALQLAGETHVDTHAFVVVGLRFAAGITPSGQPEWIAYGTLARGHSEPLVRAARVEAG